MPTKLKPKLKLKTKTKPTMLARPARFTPLLTGFDYPQGLIDKVITTMCPPVLATIDMPQFTRMLLGSYSLSLGEKNHIIDVLPTLSQWQCDALKDVWVGETKEFHLQVNTEWHIRAMLEAKYNTPPKRAWLEKAVAENHPLNDSVYGAALPRDAVLELPHDF